MNLKRTDKELKTFGVIFGLIFPIILYLKWPGAAGISAAGALAAYCLLSAFLKPALLKPLHFILSSLLELAQQAVSYAVLIICFYFIITPIGLLLRLSGKDILDMKLDRQAPSYWKARGQKSFPADHYKNQY